MSALNLSDERTRRVWRDHRSGSIKEFEAQVARDTDPQDWPGACRVERNVLIYDGAAVRSAAKEIEKRRKFMAEWAEALSAGPGVIVIKQAIAHTDVIDRASAVFDQIIENERRGGAGKGDHFAKPGSNDRIWNALEKHCVADPLNFAHYYASDAIAIASEAWLGPGYQITAQVNRVNPGGGAQSPHRDYHLGFMTPEQIESYPNHVHRVSPTLTLQGAVAHCDMPVESGPTMILPYSQFYQDGYLAFGRPEFQQVFVEHHVQLPLEKGDALFFNPALMHGAGANSSQKIFRTANLLQISSPFGRAMESVNRKKLTLALYPVLIDAMKSGEFDRLAIANVIAASAEGYAFPTNLDRDPPVDGLAPQTQAELMSEALLSGFPIEQFRQGIEDQNARKQP